MIPAPVRRAVGALALASLARAAAPPGPRPVPPGRLEPFHSALAFLGAHTHPELLRDPKTTAAVVVAPEYAGRVMISTWDVTGGPALGWINRDAIAGRRDPQFVNFGGAERLWIAPEGGQWSPFFAPGAPFDFKHWAVPHEFNDRPYAVQERDGTHVLMMRKLELTNWLGTRLSLTIIRRIALLSAAEAEPLLGGPLPSGVRFVGYQSENVLVNRGQAPLAPASGLVSLWILAMFVPSADTVVLAPFEPSATGVAVNDDYFGKIPPDRLRVDGAKGLAVFRADGKARGKIGLPAARARNVIGSMDFANGILTIVRFDKPAKGEWLRNTWQKHEDPFGGDVVNSYNDGPPGPGLPPLGGFYELEDLSPARPLAHGAKLEHRSAVLHLSGPLPALNAVAKAVLGADLTALPRP